MDTFMLTLKALSLHGNNGKRDAKEVDTKVFMDSISFRVWRGVTKVKIIPYFKKI